MKTTDQAIEYRSLLQKTKSAIEDIGSLGIDTKKYYETLESIINQVENNTSDKYRSGSTAVMFLEQDYTTGIRHLKSFYNILNKYNTYFIIINTCNYIEMELKNEHSKDDIGKYASKMIELLNSLRYSETLRYSEEQKIVEKVYELAYKLIKLEIVNFGESKIYDNSKNYEIDLSFFNECIKNELNTINLNEPKYEKLKTEIYNIKSRGIGNSYFDINIIKMIVVLNSDLDIIKNIKDNIIELINEIDINNYGLNSKVYNYNCNHKDYLGNTLEKLKKSRKQFAKSLLSVVLGISFYLGSFTGLTIVNKKNAVNKVYDKEITTYSDEYSEETSSEEFKIDIEAGRDMEEEGTVKVVKYGSWDNSGNREVHTYDMSGFNFDTLKEYLSIPLDNLEYDTFVESKDDCKYVNRINYTEVEKIVYNYRDNELYVEKFVAVEFLFLILGILWFAGIDLVILGSRDMNIFNRFKNLERNFHDLKNDKKIKKDKLEELRKEALEIMELIDKDEELKKKFNTAIERNKFLLSLDDELNKKVLNTEFKDTEQIKKLIRAK